MNALVGDVFSFDLGLYIDGFYRAAVLLVDEVDKGAPSNSLVYPICFLYRHFIEIALKEIIIRCEKLQHKTETKKRVRHELLPLLKTADKLVKNQFGGSFPEEIKQIIEEINSFDDKSDFFRYATCRKGKHFLPNHDVIGLGTLKQKMSKVHDQLKGALIGLKEYLDIQAQIEQE